MAEALAVMEVQAHVPPLAWLLALAVALRNRRLHQWVRMPGIQLHIHPVQDRAVVPAPNQVVPWLDT